jgi:hypothetical protein
MEIKPGKVLGLNTALQQIFDRVVCAVWYFQWVGCTTTGQLDCRLDGPATFNVSNLSVVGPLIQKQLTLTIPALLVSIEVVAGSCLSKRETWTRTEAIALHKLCSQSSTQFNPLVLLPIFLSLRKNGQHVAVLSENSSYQAWYNA